GSGGAVAFKPRPRQLDMFADISFRCIDGNILAKAAGHRRTLFRRFPPFMDQAGCSTSAATFRKSRAPDHFVRGGRKPLAVARSGHGRTVSPATRHLPSTLR